MKSTTLLLVALGVSLHSCMDVKPSESFLSGNDSQQNNNSTEGIRELLTTGMANVEKTKFHEIRDPNNGMIQARSPIPASWSVNNPNDPVYIDGPNGLKIYKTETNQYAWSNDPFMQQSIQMSGKTLAAPLSTQQILQQYILPSAQSQGYSLIKSYPLPEVQGFWERFATGMPNTGNQRKIEALGSDWNTGTGTKAFIILLKMETISPQSMVWMLNTTEMEVNSDDFDEAKNAYLYATANTQINPQWVAYANGKLVGDIQRTESFWADASAKSAAAHRQRMQAIAAQGNAAKSIGDTYSDILDISHKGYLNRSNINSAGHTKTVNSITGTALIGNHETGEHYNVQSGNNHYWVSNDGLYIGTDNSLFDPRIDNRTNNKEWTKFAVEQ
ncbi:hypothetical protein ATE92_0687 [Ulvibacter sp. MAR_2010_11]|uniref:hypothetical protein n=1 Tax=Ulvibacter sp. MAR_2010_11 TaxID=1250229 RepID=UPI000CADE8A2|nr:hypothetical protein [Ulvibacter sp. MAR_2010_11]PKA82556.1 hypothetical protein ATE92_0687 [Ulvibacter sp. MAR_2010_11]